MSEMISRLKETARKEIRYSRGYQAMHRERYMEYIADMHKARLRGDVKRQAEIAQDLRAFVGEMWHLMEKERSAYRRLTEMGAGQSPSTVITADTTIPVGEEPTNLVRLVLTRPVSG